MTSTIALIERYDFVDGNIYKSASMEKDCQGEWVRYTELTTLLRRVEKAEAEVEKWKATSFKWAFDEGEAVRERDEALERAEKAEGLVTRLQWQCDRRDERLSVIHERAELVEHQRDEALKALDAVDATAAFNTELGKYMIEPFAMDMVSNVRASTAMGEIK